MKVLVHIELIFIDSDLCKKVATELKAALRKNSYFLEVSLDKHFGIEINDIEAAYDRDCIVESELTRRTKNKLMLTALSKRPIDNLERLGKKVARMGAKFTRLLEVRGNGMGDVAYLIDYGCVSKSEFEKSIFPDYEEALQGVYLPGERSEVTAKLVKHSSDSSGGYIERFDFITKDQKRFVYRGTVGYQEQDILSNEQGKECTFVASFHLQKL